MFEIIVSYENGPIFHAIVDSFEQVITLEKCITLHSSTSIETIEWFGEAYPVEYPPVKR
jgi:hypothetical protein